LISKVTVIYYLPSVPANVTFDAFLGLLSKTAWFLNLDQTELIFFSISIPTLKYLIHLFYELCILVLSRNE